MKNLISSYFYGILLLVACASCTDDWPESRTSSASAVDDSKLVEARLSLGVTDMETTLQTRSGIEDISAERMINDIWVFQFNEHGQLLITPRYYDIEDMDPETDDNQVDVLLRKDVANSTVYVVANVGRDDWATVENAVVLDSLQALTLPVPKIIVGEDALGIKDADSGTQVTGDPDNLGIPMEGHTKNVTFTEDGTVNVSLTRMYAKVVITVGSIPETIELTDVNAMDIPYYCRVKTLETGDLTEAVKYPDDGHTWNSRAFKPGEKDAGGKYPGRIVLYIPENLQGCTNTNEHNPEDKIKNGEHSFGVQLTAYYVDIFTGLHNGSKRTYNWYPGGNNYNDYNIRRNYIYNVQLNIYTDTYNQDVPSSNCFVVKPGQLLSFLPYYRVETGGGYDFTDYLDAYGTDDAKKINGDTKDMTQNVKIIWQTQNAIGDNSKGNLVWIDPAPADGLNAEEKGQQEFHRKIYVRSQKRGNALIAAYNSEGDIVWSWHIWVTENEPGNVSSAILYTTYAWNEDGINTSVRVPGYDIMPCNLGALRYTPEGGPVTDTYGMLYQWGRKDPFPPATYGNNCADYNDTNTGGSHYANDNKTPVGKTIGTDVSKLFHSVAGNKINSANLPDPIGFTIENPTVFMCGTEEENEDGHYNYTTVNDSLSYANKGDWTWQHDDKLWGGLDPDTEGLTYYQIPNQDVHIYDNYGDQKSIFDPCPSGWRVPPGDLWLGFSKTGLNPSSEEDINTLSMTTTGGMYMYMTDWREGPVSYFPVQGTRVADGGIMRVNSCGNYHNATTDLNDRVNILHIHRDKNLFHIFETTYYMYYVKSVAGPIRCVRDHK